MSERGTYGRVRVGADESRGASLGTWIVGGLLVGGAVLWARHQSAQLEKLYATEGLPYQSFGANLRERTRALSSTAGEKIHALTRRLGTRKEA